MCRHRRFLRLTERIAACISVERVLTLFFLFIHQLHESYETRLDHGDVHTFSCFPLSLRLVVAPPALRPGRTNEMTKEKRRETKETARGHGPLVVLSVSAAPWDCGPYRICYSTVRRWDVLKAH